jgi:hypothetical protein
VANPNPPTDHLSPWKPGQSGNPAGRPKGRTVGAVLRDRLAATPDDDERPLADRVTDVIVREALAGDIRFVELLLNRTEGKVPDRVLHSDDDATPPRITPANRSRPDDLGGSAAGGSPGSGDAAG